MRIERGSKTKRLEVECECGMRKNRLPHSSLDARSSIFHPRSAGDSLRRLIRHGLRRLGRKPGRWRQLRRGGGRRGVQNRSRRAGVSRRSCIGQNRAFGDRARRHPATFHAIAIATTAPAEPRAFRPTKATTTRQKHTADNDHRHPTCTDHEMRSFVQKRPERAWRRFASRA